VEDVNKNLPWVAISSCLTGQAVRYDGLHKFTPLLIHSLAQSVKLLPVCPEIAIGLPVPRNKIQLIYQQGQVSALDSVDPRLDLTTLLRDFALDFIEKCPLSGLVLQEKSPSCGINNCKLFSDNGVLIGLNSGLFAATIIEQQPLLPICCAVDLQNKQVILNFIEQVFDYQNSINPLEKPMK
jgi:uncharacterized protein YbbK (DUF523 family)